jgi:Glycosyl hydrolase family 36 C-terminal domain
MPRFRPSQSENYVLRPRGLDPGKQYAVSIDTDGATETRTGAELARDGLRIEPGANASSELLLFTAR